MLLHFPGANSQLDRIQQLRDSSGLIRCGTTRIRIRYGLEPGGPGRYGCAYGMATGAVLKRAPLARRGSFGLTTPGLQSARPRTGGAGGWRWDARGHTVGLGPPGPRGCAHCARRAGAVSRHKAGEKPRRAWSKSQNSGPPGRRRPRRRRREPPRTLVGQMLESAPAVSESVCSNGSKSGS